ncbi:PAS domain-containing protein [Roseivivax sp. CAU 1753]
MSSPPPELPRSLVDYLERTGVALSVSARHDDAPLVMVNDAFCKLTGYARNEAVGRNCRFLQGADTRPEERQAMRAFMDDPDADSGRFPVLNYRKDGTAFQNFVFMTRLRTRLGQTQFILGSQFDMTTVMRRARIGDNDGALNRALMDMDQIGREFGLAMVGSAKIISDSVAMLAKLSLNDGDARR